MIPADELRAVLGVQDADAVESLRPRPFGATAGVWRVRGGGRSAVLKLLRHGAGTSKNWASSADAQHPRWWRRELEALRSGVLALEPELGPVRLLDAFDRADGSVALWLEDLGEPAEWSVAALADVAYRLGVVQARVRPELTRGFTRVYLEPRIAHLVEPFGSRREELLARLDALPHAIAHFDFHPANVFRDGDGFAVIDWAYCGSGPIGTDAGVLAADAIFDELVGAPELVGAVWEAFSSGLGDPALVEAAAETYAVGTALRYAWVQAWAAGDFGPPPTPERARAVEAGFAAFRELAEPYL